MSKLCDLQGLTFGRLTVVRRVENKGTSAAWECECTCGRKCVVIGANLRRGLQQSCGCLRSEKLSEAASTHKSSKTRLFTIWMSMIHRCENPTNTAYRNYGKRGIRVCPEWHEFVTFQEWAIQNGYNENLSIDRINNEQGYNPSNCRWVTMKEQQNNRTNNRIIEINGIKKTMAQWADETGISTRTIWYRLSVGKTGEEIIAPVRRRKNNA